MILLFYHHRLSMVSFKLAAVVSASIADVSDGCVVVLQLPLELRVDFWEQGHVRRCYLYLDFALLLGFLPLLSLRCKYSIPPFTDRRRNKVQTLIKPRIPVPIRIPQHTDTHLLSIALVEVDGCEGILASACALPAA